MKTISKNKLFWVLTAALVAGAGYSVAQYAVPPVPRLQWLNNAGQPLAGGKVTTFLAGTSTPQATYSDNIGTPNTNPITLDSQGRASIYMNGQCLKFQVQDALLNSIYTQDNVCVAGLGTLGVTIGNGQALTLSAGSSASLSANLSPTPTLTYNLGGSSNYWLNSYIGTANINRAVVLNSGAFLAYTTGGTIVSAGTITPPGPIFHVSGTTAIGTINLPAAMTSGCIDIIPDGLWTTNLAGNIALATTAVVNKELRECYDGSSSKWYPSY